MTTDRVIGPGATLGVFGGGQLGRMFLSAASRMGYRTVVFAPEQDCPASQVAGEHIRAAYEDEAAVLRFAKRCDGITIEFENIPVHCLELAKPHAPVRPGPGVLAVAQDRLCERGFLDEHGLPTSPHKPVHSLVKLQAAVASIGAPGVLKSARLGYDGRGQVKINPDTKLPDAWEQIGAVPAIYEAWVDYHLELSVLVARSAAGQIKTFGPIQNHHANHILDVSTVPAEVHEQTADQAQTIAREVADKIGLEGLICVEMFLTRRGQLLINELAPRPHNSGHLTIEACEVSQFEQQVRAVCNLPLGEMRARGPAAMINLLGDLWGNGEPDWAAALATPGAQLHLYGKEQARPGRKMGHLTISADTPEAAVQIARATVKEAIAPGGKTSGDNPNTATSPTPAPQQAPIAKTEM